jgi:large subunit ribosomal protein L28
MASCELTGLRPQIKNLVSHSNIKTKKLARPNVQRRYLYSRQLKQFVRLYVSTRALRSMDQVGGLDSFVMKQPEAKLSVRAMNFKRRLLKKIKG